MKGDGQRQATCEHCGRLIVYGQLRGNRGWVHWEGGLKEDQSWTCGDSAEDAEPEKGTIIR